MPDAQLTMDFAARDRVLTAHQRKALVRWLEYECYRDALIYGNVSANHARHILRAWGLDHLDARLLGGVFPVSRWAQVGETHSDSGRCHARKIRVFAPRPDVTVDPVARPDWLEVPRGL